MMKDTTPDTSLAPCSAGMYQQYTVPMLMGAAMLLVLCAMVYLSFFDRTPGI